MQKTHHPVVNKKHNRLWWLFPITGFLALIWYLVRVVPKPSRASYPCQRAAAPLAGGFILWLGGFIGSVLAFRKARHLFRQSRTGWAFICIAVVLAAGVMAIIHIPQEPAMAVSEANTPICIAKGIQPGRVTWAYDPNATHWDGFTSPEHWYESDHTNLAVVEKMVSQVIRGTAGKSTDAAAWVDIFKYNNRERGRGEVGYQVGEKIFIKINLVTCNARFTSVNPTTYEKEHAFLNRIDVSPQVILALLRQLVNTVGATQSDITIGDPTAMIPNHYWNFLHIEFPNVNYLDNYGGSGRTRAEFSSTPFYWSTSNADNKLQDYLPTAVAEADYLINLAVLKGHSSGVSLCAKNHYGTLIRCPDGYLRDTGIADYYDTHTCLPNAAWSPGPGHYRAHVDLMGHPGIGGKTILYMLDGLYSGYYWDARPVKWKLTPFGSGSTGDWPSSVFASLDPVAIDSVGYDFLLAEWPDVVNYGGGPSLQGGAEDYLHEAAQADNPPSGTFYDPDRNAIAMESLGVHEHWNNAADKLYTRNLGIGNGIELFKISNPGGLPVVMSLNRMQLNFAYVMGGSLPGPQSFMITRTGSGVCSWVAEENTSWFDNSPTSGNNAAKITVSVDPSGLAVGTYTGVISVTDLNSSGAALALTVNLRIFSSGTDLQPFGNFATPVEGSTVRSSIPVTGWVLDDVGVESVKIYRQDGAGLVYIGDALTVEGARPDVEIAYPDYPMNYKAGWGYMMLTHFLPGGGNGSFTFYVVARDSSGHEVTLGTRTVTCDNAHAVKPFGAIDTPAQGGEASGLKYRNQGWVLTPMPNNIPSTGKTINVYIDGVYKGHPIYNIYRPDVASLFPGYANSNGSLGYFDFDTTHYDDGVHTIYWVAEDNAGNADGIGSRYFSVRNPVGDMGRQSLGRGEPACPPHSSVLASQCVYARKNGNRIIEIKELERIEIQVGANAVGYQLVAGQRRPLPIGSTLDSERGIFYWTPGPGFLGKYDFIFIVSDKTGRRVPQDITIKIY